MRRQDKALAERAAIDRIIREAPYCHLACSLDDRPYLIPISFGYDGQAVYVHTAPEGRKIDIFQANPRVCLAFVSQSELVRHPRRACKWSYAYTSALAEGRIQEISGPEEKLAALNLIMVQYSGREWDFKDSDLSGMRVWKIPLERVSGKTSPPPGGQLPSPGG